MKQGSTDELFNKTAHLWHESKLFLAALFAVRSQIHKIFIKISGILMVL